MSSMMEASSSLGSLAESAKQAGSSESLVSSMLGEVGWFVAGYCMICILVRLGILPRMGKGSPQSAMRGGQKMPRHYASCKNTSAAENTGSLSSIRQTWDDKKVQGPLPISSLRDVTRALAILTPDKLSTELTVHCERFPDAYSQPDMMNSLAGVLAQSGQLRQASALVTMFEEKLGIRPDEKTQLILRSESCVKCPGAGDTVAARGDLLAIREFLKNRDVDAATERMLSMHEKNFVMPPRAVTELFRVASSKGIDDVTQALDRLDSRVQIPDAAFTLLLDYCLNREDVQLARRLDSMVTQRQVKTHYNIYEPLLKLFARSCDARALELFENMQKAGFQASEGLCGCLLARCGLGQNLRFAEVVADYLRGQSKMSLAIFKTLMKVFASCGKFDRACNLYYEVLEHGIEPDHVMYGCLVKFAFKCNRKDLSEELFRRSNGGDIQNYMWLLRAAGREGDVARAEELLAEAKVSHEGNLDASLQNCMLDVYITNNHSDKAQSFFDEMFNKGIVNIVTYNTLMKSYCAQNDLEKAKSLLKKMDQDGFKPDSISFNCLLGNFVAAGKIHETWPILAEMERQEVAYDHFTVSIMMKLAKRAKNPKDAEKALAVLDKANQERILQDDVLFNTVIDVCIHKRDVRRLRNFLKVLKTSDIKPSVQTYGLLIKAYNILNEINRCHELWTEMVDQRGLAPNDITLSCMLDALTSAKKVHQAVQLFHKWKDQIAPNIIMYGTLIKGFATINSCEGATDMYNELVSQGIKMNVLAYTSLIDAHARVGQMEPVRRFYQKMQDEGCEPNIITHSAVIKGYCVEGNLEEAFSVFTSIAEKGLTVDTVLFNTLLDGCVRHSRFQLADCLLGEMESYNLTPSQFTHSILVKMWGKRGCLDKAFDVVWSTVQDSRRTFDTQIATCFLSACFYNKVPKRALEVVEEMRSWPGLDFPDPGVFSVLIPGLIKSGMTRKAVEVVLQACDNSEAHKLPLDGLRALMNALQQENLYQELGQSLLDRLRATCALAKNLENQEAWTPRCNRAADGNMPHAARGQFQRRREWRA